jgi:CBS domain-containing protein
LVEIGLVGGAYIACRIIGKTLGAHLGLKWSKALTDQRPVIGAALLCQAAVVIGLADFVENYWSDPWAERFVSVALGSIVVFEVCGPLLTKLVAKNAGEVKAVTLLRRTSNESLGTLSALSLSWRALLRTVGLGRRRTNTNDEPLQARHVMRTTIKSIPADADFSDVLKFIEHSRFNHFPVVDENQELVGVIHFSDIRGVIYDPLLSKLITAVDVASTDSHAVPADLPLDDLLRVFQEGDVGSVPVVESQGSRTVVGIVEQRDVLRVIHQSGSA